jgi:hypothetical protein
MLAAGVWMHSKDNALSTICNSHCMLSRFGVIEIHIAAITQEHPLSGVFGLIWIASKRQEA